MKKRRLKRKIKRFFRRLVLLIILIVICVLSYKSFFNKNYIDNIELSNNKLIVYLKDEGYSCILSVDKPTPNDNWIESKDKTCEFDLVDTHTNIYLKNEDKIINGSEKKVFYELKDIKEMYLAQGEEYNLFKYLIGNIDKLNINYNDSIINFDNGIITAIKDGKTEISIKYDENEYSSIINVSKLINKMEIKTKEALSCKKYSDEESLLLDKILKNRIENVGYKTRAGAVEAARFLALSFPYKIEYFYENGRQTTNNVDGEGRYYHVGLYLNESKFEDLTGSSYTANKGIWGCKVYSYPDEKKTPNGLDCSGFVSWALLNGGYDVKDVGAGWSDKLDLTDYGEVLKLNSENYTKLRVGDLLHSERLGGHIGIIVGIDSKNIYVAQAIWYDENGLVVTKIKKEKLYKDFPHGVLMDDYYESDGNLTEMW